MKNSFYLFSIASLMAIIFVGCDKASEESNVNVKTVNATRVKTANVSNRFFENRFSVQGSIEASVSANVAALVPGNLDTIWVDEGDAVVAGVTKLFQIDPISLSNQVVIAEQALAVARSQHEVAKASLESTRASLDKAELDYNRYKRLHNEKRVTDNEFEVRNTSLRQARANLKVGEAQVALCSQQVEQAEAQLLIASKSLSDSLAIAPISGRVSARNFDPGEYASSGKVVISIVDVDKLEAAAFVPSIYFDRIKAGETRIRLSVAGRDLGEAVVSYRSPVVDTTLRTFEIKAELDGEMARSFAPGMMVDATLVFERHEALGAPSSAVLIRGGESVVFIANGDKAEQRVVRTAFVTDGWIEITSGLKAGDAVIFEGHTIVRDGSPIEIVN